MNVPIEIARQGLTEEYVNLLDELQKLRGRQSGAKLNVREKGYNLFEFISETTRTGLYYSDVRTEKRDCGNVPWTEILIIKEIASQLAELKGIQIEVDALVRKKEGDLNRLLKKAGVKKER